MSDQSISDSITKSAGTSFSVSFALLPREKRDAIRAVYAFCRCTDDIVDEGMDKVRQAELLQQWTVDLKRSLSDIESDPVLDQLVRIIHRYGIPKELPFELIDGMRMDLEKERYETFEELYDYCYHVASTVGLMCSRIFGYTDESSLMYARKLGIALQLTNIIRDVSSDAGRGRIYIPREDLRRFGYSEESLFAHEYSPSFVNLMRYQAERARRYYREAQETLPVDDFRSFVAARIMGSVYSRLLHKIEKRKFDVFGKRIRLSKMSKLTVSLLEYFRRPAPASGIRQ
jgi:phytoene synthase